MTVISATGVRKARLGELPEFDAVLTYYPAGLQQRAHEHRRSTFSMILAGSLVERVEGREHSAGPGQVSAKPGGISHADTYGPHGAVLLSFQFRCAKTARAAMGKGDWHWRLPRKDGPALALDAIRQSGRQYDLLWDVLGVSEHRSASGEPPEWLKWARSELDCRERLADIGVLAAQAGVHRVHFSRQFVRHYGLAPSAYRQRQMAGRALRAMVDDQLSGAAAAHDAGFADQSHMTRAVRSAFGTTPRRIAALLAH